VIIALRLALVALLAAALYFRLARHNAGAYYVLFGGWIAVLAVYQFRRSKK
jgi:hypothetical protein